ncbi:MAG: response regulator transcription factor [Chloroflexota bacterium]
MKSAQLLLADDHALVRAGIVNAISSMPEIEVVGEVGDGRSLMEQLEKLQPDCLLLDVTMPDFEPIKAIQQIRALYPEMRILVVSAYDDDVYVQGLLSAGVNGYHLKDQPLSDLRLAIQRVLNGERWISSSLLDKLLKPRVTANPTHKVSLSERQRDLLRLLAKGLDNRAIANRLQLSIKTIENHLTRLYRQLDVQSRLEAATYAQNHPELLAATGKTAVSPPVVQRPATSKPVIIILIDDSRRYRQQLRRMVGKAYPNVMIYEASNIKEGANLVSQVTPQIAFVDVVLGDEDGIRCTRKLKSIHAAIRVILMSAYPDREFHRRGIEAGATAFLDKKDLDVATLNQILEDLMA